MSIKFITPKKSVNSAFLKLPVPCGKMERFQAKQSNAWSHSVRSESEVGKSSGTHRKQVANLGIHFSKVASQFCETADV